MEWFWCQLYNNTPFAIKVVVISQYGQGTYFINSGQYQWTQWYPGQKAMTLFNLQDGHLLLTYSFNVDGPRLYKAASAGVGPMVAAQIFEAPLATTPPAAGAAVPE